MAKNTSTRNKERREEALRDLDRELRVRDRAEKSKPLGVAAASVLVIVAIVGGIWWAANQNGDDKNTDQQAQNSTSATPDPAANTQPLATARTNPLPETVNCTYTPEGQAAREVSVPPAENIPATGTVTVTLNTNAGPIGMTLDISLHGQCGSAPGSQQFLQRHDLPPHDQRRHSRAAVW